MKGSNYRALTRNKNYCYFKVVWIADHLWAVVSYERYLVTYKLLLQAGSFGTKEVACTCKTMFSGRANGH